MAKTREEVERLKTDWEKDPNWDLETTEGFEGHRDELLEFSNQKHRQWRYAEENRIQQGMAKYGCSRALFLELDRLKAENENLANRLEHLETRELGREAEAENRFIMGDMSR